MSWTQKKHDIIGEAFRSLSKPDREEWLRHREACDRSLYYFIKEIGGCAKKAGGIASEEIHKPICDFWQDSLIRRKGVFMPRYWMKTTMLTEWGHLWEYLRDNEIRILIPTEKADTGYKWLRFIEAQILNHARLRWLYPELTVVNNSYSKRNPWSGEQCLLPRDGIYPEPTMTVTGIRGASQGGHYDLVDPDDLVGEKGMESKLVLEDALRWLDNADELLVNPDMTAEDCSSIRIVGTHWASGDYGCYIQDHSPECKWMIVPCRNTDTIKTASHVTYLNNPNVGKGDSNWPDRFSTDHYIKLSVDQPLIYWTQHMNHPRGMSEEGLNKFDIRWLRYYHLEVIGHNGKSETMIVCEDDNKMIPLSSVMLYGMIDPGGFAETKLLKTGARNAVVLGGQPADSIKKFVLHTWAGRPKDTNKFLEQVYSADSQWHVRHWKIETIAAQEYIKRDIMLGKTKKEWKDRYPGITNMSISSMPKQNKKDEKDDDIQALIPVARNGELYIQAGMKDLISEIQDYPQGLTKDLIDMVGKLNKYYWSRRKLKDISDKNTIGAMDYAGISPITGY